MISTSRMNIKGQVWTYDENEDGYELFTGKIDNLSAGFMNEKDYSEEWIDIDGIGFIEYGKLNFIVGTPSRMQGTIGEFYSGWKLSEYDDLHISNENAIFAHVTHIKNNHSSIGRENCYLAGNKLIIEGVEYVYVDRNFTVTGRGNTVHKPDRKEIYQNLNLSFKEGWNACHYKMTDQTIAGLKTLNISYSLNDPSHIKWILDKN